MKKFEKKESASPRSVSFFFSLTTGAGVPARPVVKRKKNLTGEAYLSFMKNINDNILFTKRPVREKEENKRKPCALHEHLHQQRFSFSCFRFFLLTRTWSLRIEVVYYFLRDRMRTNKWKERKAWCGAHFSFLFILVLRSLPKDSQKKFCWPWRINSKNFFCFFLSFCLTCNVFRRSNKRERSESLGVNHSGSTAPFLLCQHHLWAIAMAFNQRWWQRRKRVPEPVDWPTGSAYAHNNWEPRALTLGSSRAPWKREWALGFIGERNSFFFKKWSSRSSGPSTDDQTF